MISKIRRKTSDLKLKYKLVLIYRLYSCVYYISRITLSDAWSIA